MAERSGGETPWLYEEEEHQKSAIYCFSTAYAGAVDEECQAVAELIACLHRAVYIHGSRDGWDHKLRALFEQMSKAKYVRSEEFFGPKLRPLEHDTCCHTLDDIVNHGPADSLWCYVNERYIRQLINTPNNGKDYEKTLTKRAEVEMVVEWLTQRRKEAELRRLGRALGDDLWEKARAAFEGGLLFASSQGEAKALACELPTASRSKQEESDEAISSSIKERGVAVGALPANWRSRNFEDLGPEQQDGVNRLLESLESEPIESRLEQSSVVPLRSVQFGEHNYAKGDFFIVGVRDAEEFGQVKHLYSASDSEGERRVFADLAFFRVKFSDGVPSGHDLHNCLLLTALGEVGRDRVRLALHFLRHFIPLPQPRKTVLSSTENAVIEVYPPRFSFEAQDVWVPLYPKVRPQECIEDSMHSCLQRCHWLPTCCHDWLKTSALCQS
jgi:hypothetical protein